MSLNRIDMELLRRDLIGAALLCLVGIAAGAYVWWVFDGARQGREDDVFRLNSKLIEVRQMRSDLNIARQRYPAYVALQQAGVIGGFHKARELDRFESALRGNGIAVRGFALGTLEPVVTGNAGAYAKFLPGRYQLTFSAQVLHERQFAQLVETVRRSLGGLGTLESCTLTRDANGLVTNVNQQQATMLNARCTVAWYVLTPTQAETVAAAAAPMPMDN
jgi:hypothetical protein